MWWEKLDIEKNDTPNYWKISNDTNKHYVDIMNTKSDLSESEYNSVSKMRMPDMNVEMSEISDVLIILKSEILSWYEPYVINSDIDIVNIT